jgi:hypothetical protein
MAPPKLPFSYHTAATRKIQSNFVFLRHFILYFCGNLFCVFALLCVCACVAGFSRPKEDFLKAVPVLRSSHSVEAQANRLNNHNVLILPPQ